MYEKKLRSISVLHVLGGPLDMGGISHFILNHYRELNRENINFDFLAMGHSSEVLTKNVHELGGHVFDIPYKHESLLKNLLSTYSVIKNNKYDIVHCHLDAMNIVPILISKMAGVQVVISHSHNTSHTKPGFFRSIVHTFLLYLSRCLSVHKFACSKEAGIFLFGEKAVSSGEVRIVYNAISLSRFKFNSSSREVIRGELGLDKAFIIGMVGRLDQQKNHNFMLKLAETLKIYTDVVFVVVGDGELKSLLFNYTKTNELRNVVWFGESSEVYNMLNAFDLFIMPSLFEGLGIACIEAQVNKLPCIVSRGVPQSASISDGIEFLDFDVDAWVEKILFFKSSRFRNNMEVNSSDYDIVSSSKKLECTYMELFGNEI